MGLPRAALQQHGFGPRRGRPTGCVDVAMGCLRTVDLRDPCSQDLLALGSSDSRRDLFGETCRDPGSAACLPSPAGACTSPLLYLDLGMGLSCLQDQYQVLGKACKLLGVPKPTHSLWSVSDQTNFSAPFPEESVLSPLPWPICQLASPVYQESLLLLQAGHRAHRSTELSSEMNPAPARQIIQAPGELCPGGLVLGCGLPDPGSSTKQSHCSHFLPMSLWEGWQFCPPSDSSAFLYR